VLNCLIAIYRARSLKCRRQHAKQEFDRSAQRRRRFSSLLKRRDHNSDRILGSFLVDHQTTFEPWRCQAPCARPRGGISLSSGLTRLRVDGQRQTPATPGSSRFRDLSYSNRFRWQFSLCFRGAESCDSVTHCDYQVDNEAFCMKRLPNRRVQTWKKSRFHLIAPFFCTPFETHTQNRP
jgi:hypothetical protein